MGWRERFRQPLKTGGDEGLGSGEWRGRSWIVVVVGERRRKKSSIYLAMCRQFGR